MVVYGTQNVSGKRWDCTHNRNSGLYLSSNFERFT